MASEKRSTREPIEERASDYEVSLFGFFLEIAALFSVSTDLINGIMNYNSGVRKSATMPRTPSSFL